MNLLSLHFTMKGAGLVAVILLNILINICIYRFKSSPEVMKNLFSCSTQRFLSNWNSMLSIVEYEKCLITFGPYIRAAID